MLKTDASDFTNKHGSFINGKLFHLGIVNYFNGDKYKGNFKDGRPCGQGTMTYTYSLPGSSGVEFENGTYEGMWKAGKREGQGVLTWADGSTFKGIWKNDNRHKGTMRRPNGNTYIGYF